MLSIMWLTNNCLMVLWLVMMPLWTTVNSFRGSLEWGCEFLASGGPWVAHRVCAIPAWLLRMVFSSMPWVCSCSLVLASRASMLPVDLMISMLLVCDTFRMQCCRACRFLAGWPLLLMSSKLAKSNLGVLSNATAVTAARGTSSMQRPALSYLQWEAHMRGLVGTTPTALLRSGFRRNRRYYTLYLGSWVSDGRCRLTHFTVGATPQTGRNTYPRYSSRLRPVNSTCSTCCLLRFTPKL